MPDGVDVLTIALEAPPKALVYLAVVLAVGACTARLLYHRRVATRPGAFQSAVDDRDRPPGALAGGSPAAAIEAPLARLALLAAVLLLGGLLLRAWAHTAVSFGPADAFAWENLSLIAWESQWGGSWKLQLAGGAFLLVCTRSIGHLGRTGWTLSAGAAVAMCFLLPLLGHAAGEPSGVALHGAHILGAGVWVGTLLAMALALRGERREAMLRAFAPFAFAGASVLGATGAIAAWWYVGSPLNVFRSPYGWALVMKLLLVADVALFGMLNWRRFHRPAAAPTRTAAGSAVDGRRSTGDTLVLLEAIMAVAVIVVTAVLTELEHP